MLVLYSFSCNGVEFHGKVVVCRFQAVEEPVGNGKEWHVFDIRVVFGGISDNVVDVVVSFPPTDGETAEKVCNEDTNAGVDMEGVGYAHMTGVVGCEYELMPEESDEEAGKGVLRVVEGGGEEAEEEDIATGFDGVG